MQFYYSENFWWSKIQIKLKLPAFQGSFITVMICFWWSGVQNKLKCRFLPFPRNKFNLGLKLSIVASLTIKCFKKCFNREILKFALFLVKYYIIADCWNRCLQHRLMWLQFLLFWMRFLSLRTFEIFSQGSKILKIWENIELSLLKRLFTYLLKLITSWKNLVANGDLGYQKWKHLNPTFNRDCLILEMSCLFFELILLNC